ncbi:MAG: flagellar hook protein FlgE [Pirellulaceae bacterium]
MPNSLNTGVSGLLAHQRQLDMVANNLANINTTGYKSQRIVFSDLMYELLSPATNGNGVSVGGTNPIQIGSGTKTGQIARNFGQGGFNATGQPLDFALQGDGFFVVSDGNQDLYTRSGAFSLDESGILIDPATGFPVKRFGPTGENNLTGPSFQVPGDDRIRIPLGETIFGVPTGSVAFHGNLQAGAAGPEAQILTSANPFEVAGVAATLTTLLNDVDTNLVDYQAGDAIELTGTNDDGSPFSVTMAADGTTMLGDVVNELNNVLVGSVASMDAAGNLVITSDEPGTSMTALAFDDAAGNVGQTDLHTHSMLASTIGRDGDILTGESEIFDVRGGSHTLGYEFQKIGTNTWNLNFSLPDGDGTVIDGSVDGIEFSDDGTLVGVGGLTNSLVQVTVRLDDILQDQSFDIDLTNLIQIASPFTMAIEQDGLEPGKLINVRVNSDGVLQGISSTGESFDIAQMAIALFRNPQGLIAVGSSYFEASLNSGNVELGAAAAGGRGAIRGGQLEGSNVDVAFEFTQLIVAQRGFSANARTITVADEVLEELTNIIR